MIRCTIELLPGGDETRRRVIGLVEIANIGVKPDNFGEYAVVLKKCPPFRGALRQAWRQGKLKVDSDGAAPIDVALCGVKDGVTKTLPDAAEEAGISAINARNRRDLGWPDDRLFESVRERGKYRKSAK